MAKKITPADRLEAQIRAGYLPSQIARHLNEIQDIETNFAWCATEQGRAQQRHDHNFTDEELDAALEKQKENIAIIQEKVDFLKGLFNQQESKSKA